MRRALTRLGLGLTAVLTLSALALLAVWFFAWRQDAPAEIIDVTGRPLKTRLGETVTVDVIIRLPWHRRVTAPLSLVLPTGLQQTGEEQQPAVSRIGIGYADWSVATALQPVDFGPFTDLSAQLPLSPCRDGSDSELVIPIPPISVAARFGETEEPPLAVAGKMTAPAVEPAPPPRWPWALAAAIAIAVLCVLLRRRRTTVTVRRLPPPVPAWIVAENALQTLERGLPMNADIFFVTLVDTLRNYLEAAFRLRATEQTTVEFLSTMQASPDLLSLDHRALLEEVIVAADFVKFARTDASDEQMHETLTKARRFVRESSEPLRRPSSNPGQFAANV